MMLHQPQAWSAPPDQPVLSFSDVHVWLVSLHQQAVAVRRLAEILSADEGTRAERFRFDEDRRDYIVARGCLRTILGLYLGQAPEKIEFTYGEYGKPGLANSTAQLKFNVAHSGALALYAFTLIGEVGVDLEFIPPITVDEVARRFFSPDEVAGLEQFYGLRRQEAFYRCWTRKEAFVKAKQVGLSLALDQFDVTLDSEPAALLRTRWDESEAARWSLYNLDVGTDYAGAMAIEARGSKLSSWRLDEIVGSINTQHREETKASGKDC